MGIASRAKATSRAVPPMLLIAIFFLQILFVNALDVKCYTRIDYPVRPALPLPKYEQCEAAIQLLRDEPGSDQVIQISTSSHLVPIHGYLYPHAWTSGDCSVGIGFGGAQKWDCAALAELADRATGILGQCRTQWHQYGGWTSAGRYGKLKVTVRHKDVLPGIGYGDRGNGTETASTPGNATVVETE